MVEHEQEQEQEQEHILYVSNVCQLCIHLNEQSSVRWCTPSTVNYVHSEIIMIKIYKKRIVWETFYESLLYFVLKAQFGTAKKRRKIYEWVSEWVSVWCKEIWVFND